MIFVIHGDDREPGKAFYIVYSIELILLMIDGSSISVFFLPGVQSSISFLSSFTPAVLHPS